ncbi:PAS domain-containing protein [Maribacter polysiphoniae]|uniref:histidine kinase n=1 Tax=Maribacter polysiphoniae TaxID=429344 RepID=A0A316E231_9FLAO|nr:PAS domain-containing protein [Maribacter polysiphoniae]MBD1258971.1 PAS domain-containing protein [Maribacter polysiphoniae]PWK24524.1 PAS domain S-box-containing protein [Maribacter polysiphoniae]
MFRNRVEFLPSFEFFEIPRSAYKDIYHLASYIFDSPSAKIEILKLPNILGTSLNFEFSGSKTEERILDHLGNTPNTVLELHDIPNGFDLDKQVKAHKPKVPEYMIVAPLQDAKGEILGILCMHDNKTISVDNRQKQAFKVLANQTVSLITLYQEEKRPLMAQTLVDNKNITLGNFMEANDSANWRFDTAKGHLWFNPLFFEMLGYTPEELKLESVDSWIDMVYFFDQDRFKDTWQKWNNNELLNNELECRMVHRSGDIVFVTIEINNSKINDAGKPILLEGEIQDVSTQKKVWEQIELINPKYTSVIQAGYNWMAIVDSDGTYTYVNKTLESALGYSSEELIDQCIFNLVHEDERKRVINYFSKFLNNEPFISKPFRYQHKNGTWKWIEILCANLMEDPMIQGVVINARDITKRVMENKEIKASEEKHRLLFNASPYPKYFLELDSLRILDVNNAMIQFYGYTKEELLNMNATDLRPKEEINKLLISLENYRIPKEIFKSGVFVHKKKNGELVEMDIVGQHIYIDGSQCILVTCNDVTENRTNQIAIEKQNKKLREIAWMQSHIVRAPLARMMGIIELFYGNLVDENEKIEMLDHVYSSALELDTIIKDIVLKSQSIISKENS